MLWLDAVAVLTITGQGPNAAFILGSVSTTDGFLEVVAVAATSPWQSLYGAGLSSHECSHWPAAKEVLMGII